MIRYLLGWERAESQTTELERMTLTKYAAGRKHLCEIGVFEGLTTGLLARAMASDGILHAVDPFSPGRLGICWGKWIAHREVAKTSARSRVKFVEEFSFDAIPLIVGQLDFLFIDGDHSLKGIERDWIDWSPRIALGGIVALHDTQVPPHNPAVAQLGSYLYFETHIRHDARFQVVEKVDSLSVLRRNS